MFNNFIVCSDEVNYIRVEKNAIKMQKMGKRYRVIRFKAFDKTNFYIAVKKNTKNLLLTYLFVLITIFIARR